MISCGLIRTIAISTVIGLAVCVPKGSAAAALDAATAAAAMHRSGSRMESVPVSRINLSRPIRARVDGTQIRLLHKLDIGERVERFSVPYPAKWRPSAVKYRNAEMLVRDANKARLLVTTEERRNPEEALRRLEEIAGEYDVPVRVTEIGGWPAIERQYTAVFDKIGPSHRPPKGGPVFTQRVTTAIAIGSRVVRMETTLAPEVDPAIAKEAKAIGRFTKFNRRARPEQTRLRLDVLRKKLQVEPGKTEPKSGLSARRVQVARDDRRVFRLPNPPVFIQTPVAPETTVGNAVLARGGVGEIEIAVSDNNQDILIGSNDGRAFSTDGGETYTAAGNPNFGFPINGDPSLAVGAGGDFYWATIGFPNGTAAANNETGCSLPIAASGDGGQTFNFVEHSALCPQSGAGVCFTDQEHIAADRFTATPAGDDQIYTVWRNFTPAAGNPQCDNFGSGFVTNSIVCSDDSGANWTAPAVVGNGDFPRVAVGPNSFVYVVYRSGNNVMLNKYNSCRVGLNQQAGFPVTVATVSNVVCPVPGLDRCNDGNNLSSHMVAIDDGNANRVFVAYATNTAAGNENIVVRGSTDGGSTWPGARAATVNQSVTARRFMPWVCATDGTAYVSWFDRRAATVAGNDRTDYYVASATNDGNVLRAGPETNLSVNPDPQCASGWPCQPRSSNDSEGCSVQPQLAGSCLTAAGGGSGIRCDFTSTACPAGETCRSGGGCPKYGDYNGNTCNDGRVFLAWASDTAPPGVVAGAGLQVYAARLPATGGADPHDYNNDGFADIAVGVSQEDVDSTQRAGAVNVIYGSAGGLTSVGDQIWHQGTTGIEGAPETGDILGFSVATGDFNGDGFADLAAGAQGEAIGNRQKAGAVNVIYGSASGLRSSGDQIWHQDTSGIEGAAEADDKFGYALATGHFNNDAYADLAIGAVGEAIGNIGSAGAVNVIYGSAAGLTSSGDQIWHQDSTNIEDTAEGADLFGTSLATGDFNGDGLSDLAIGVQGENVPPNNVSGGAVAVLYGAVGGLSASGDQLWHQDSPGIEGGAESLDGFGWAVATGYFNDDSYADLAIGANREDIGSKADAGAVNVIYGSASGLSAGGDQIWHQDSSGIEGASEAGDEFGSALAAGDFNNDGFSDLAIGSPNEDIGTKSNAGAVNVIYGSAAGLSSASDQIWYQDSGGILGASEPGDRFGADLAARDLNGDGYDDLVIGVHSEGIGSLGDAGAINVLYGSPAGLASPGNQLWSQDSGGIDGAAEAGDNFGASL